MSNGGRRALVWARTLLPLIAIAVAATVVALVFTPKVPVSVFGQTVEVGAVRPSLSLSGPGQADLFGEGALETVQHFDGPVRPLIVWARLQPQRRGEPVHPVDIGRRSPRGVHQHRRGGQGVVRRWGELLHPAGWLVGAEGRRGGKGLSRDGRAETALRAGDVMPASKEIAPPKAAEPGRKRTAARLAAVQALYQIELTSADRRRGRRRVPVASPRREIDGDKYGEADHGFFAELVDGAATRRDGRRSAIVASALPPDWPLERLESVLRAILRARHLRASGAAPTCRRASSSASIVEIAHAFFAGKEPGHGERRARPGCAHACGEAELSEDRPRWRRRSSVSSSASRASSRRSRRRRDLGLVDDVALIDGPPGEQYVLTTDAIVEGVHFLPDDPADQVAQKLLRVNLSDLAAKGAVPVGYLLMTALPRERDEAWLERFAQGSPPTRGNYGIGLLGGDSVGHSRTGDAVGGRASGRVAAGEAVLRSGARPGDLVYVSGTLGDAALGLGALRGQLPELGAAERELSRRPLSPAAAAPGARATPRRHRPRDDRRLRRAGRRSRPYRRGVRAAARMRAAARCRYRRRRARRLPADAGGSRRCSAAATITSCFSPLIHRWPLRSRPQRAMPACMVTGIGTMEAGQGVRVFDDNGQEIAVAQAGYSHF